MSYTWQKALEKIGKKINGDISEINSQIKDIHDNSKKNRHFKPKIYAYLSQGGSRKEETYGTREDWIRDCKSFVDAGIKDIGLSIQIQPTKSSREDFEKNKITTEDLEWNTYPTLEKAIEMVDTAKEQGLNLYIVKMQETWIKEQENLGKLKFSDYSDKYNALTEKFANSSLNMEWLTIYNEHDKVINTLENFEIIKNTLMMIKSKGKNTGFSGVPNINAFYTEYIDAWMPHYYPSISWKKQETTFEDGVYGWLGLSDRTNHTPLEQVRRKRNEYPGKKILITEIGCSHFWEDLLYPEGYTYNGTPDEKGTPTAIFLNGFFEVFKDEDFDSVGIYYTNPLREEPSKIIKRELGGI